MIPTIYPYLNRFLPDPSVLSSLASTVPYLVKTRTIFAAICRKKIEAMNDSERTTTTKGSLWGQYFPVSLMGARHSSPDPSSYTTFASHPHPPPSRKGPLITHPHHLSHGLIPHHHNTPYQDTDGTSPPSPVSRSDHPAPSRSTFLPTPALTHD